MQQAVGHDRASADQLAGRPWHGRRSGRELSPAIAERTLASRAEVDRRIHEAVDLDKRNGLTGEPLAPVLVGTAAAQRAGERVLGRSSEYRSFQAIARALPPSPWRSPAPSGRVSGSGRPMVDPVSSRFRFLATQMFAKVFSSGSARPARSQSAARLTIISTDVDFMSLLRYTRSDVRVPARHWEV